MATRKENLQCDVGNERVKPYLPTRMRYVSYAIAKSNIALTLLSNYKFSFCVSIYFLQKYWGEAVKISIEFNLSDHIVNSHDLSN